MEDKAADASYHMETDAQEILPGEGFEKIRIGYKFVFSKKEEVREYDFVYLSGAWLVMVTRVN